MKAFTLWEHNPLLLLASGNLMLEALHKWMLDMQPIISSLVSLGQFGVAVVTILYILRKTRLLTRSSAKKQSRKIRKPL